MRAPGAGRIRRTTAARRALAVIVLALLLAVPAALPAQPKILYIYDDLNRLIGVIDQQGNAATYTYDAVGNILKIERFTVDPAGTPSLTAISPSSAQADTTLPVTIQGQNLLAVRSVTTSNPAIAVQLVNAAPDHVDTVFVIGPDAAIGSATVTVTTALGAASIAFTVLQRQPVLTQLAPDAGLPGATITARGQSLTAPGLTTSATFAGSSDTRIPATLTAPATPTAVTVTVPPGTVTGDVVITVGPLSSNGVTFTRPLPSVSVNPANGSTNVPATSVVVLSFSQPIDPASVTASSFTLSQAGTPVSGSVSASSTSASFQPPQSLAFQTTYTVTMTSAVTTTDGLSLTPFTSTFTTEQQPAGTIRFDGITGVATSGTPALPAQASTNGDQVLTVRGAGFAAAMSLRSPRANRGVFWDNFDFPLSNVSADGTTAQATVPKFPFGVGIITGLTRIVGPNSTQSPQSVLLQAVPTLTQVSVPSGAAFTPGTTLTLTGSALTADMKMRFPLAAGGSLDQTIVANSVSQFGSQAQVVIPAGVGPGPLAAVTPGGVSAPLTIPALTRLENADGTLARATTGTPADAAQASTNGDQVLVVRGAGLVSGMTLRFPRANRGVFWDLFDVALSSISADGTTAQVTVPKFPFGVGIMSGQVRLVAPTGVQSAQTLLLQAVPTLTQVSVPSGAAFTPGTTLTLTGSAFTADMLVRFPLAAGGSVDQPIVANSVSQFGSQAAVVIPNGIGPGALTVVTPGGSAALTIPTFTRLENPDGTLARATTGTPADAAQASTNGDQVQVVRGAGLVSGMTLRFPRANRGVFWDLFDAGLTSISADGTTAQVNVPKFPFGVGIMSGQVRLVAPSGVQSAQAPLLQAVPTLTQVSVPSGAAFTPGTTLTLFGSVFTADMVVRFPLAAGGTVDQPIVANSVSQFGSQAEVVIPNGIGPGPLAVVTPGGVSAPLTIPAFTRLENPDGTLARATTGAPADSTQASTNGDQVLVVRGAGLAAGMSLRAPRANRGVFWDNFDLGLSGVSADGTTAQVTVPKFPFGVGIMSGQVRVVVPNGVQSAQSLLLQAVPTLTGITLGAGGFADGQTITLTGSAFTADMVVRFPLAAGGSVDQPIVVNTVSQFGSEVQVVIPTGAARAATTAVTPGGVSNALTP